MTHKTATTVLTWFVSLAAAAVAVVCIEYMDWIEIGLTELLTRLLP